MTKREHVVRAPAEQSVVFGKKKTEASLEVACPICHAGARAPCVSVGVVRHGERILGLHVGRTVAAGFEAPMRWHRTRRY